MPFRRVLGRIQPRGLEAAEHAVVTVRGTAPVLGLIGDRAIDEGGTLTFTATATAPGSALTFSLDAGAPAGAAIDPATGVFTWTPTEAQGPGTSRSPSA